MSEPKHLNFVWVGCPNADPDGLDANGQPHWPCQTCSWESNAAKKPKKKGSAR